jgi:trigger factor
MMQVTEKRSEGLTKQFEVVLSASELETRLNGELANLKDKVNINGFRPGKVPLPHLRRLYGRSVMAEVVQNAVNEANRQILNDNNLKLAMEPKVEFAKDEAALTKVMEAKGDLAFTVDLELLPQFELADHSNITITRGIAEVSDADVEEALITLSKQSRNFVERGAKEAAQSGDQVVIDFVGRVDGVAFEGGTAQGVDLEIGSGSFIPGFEDQLIGAKIGQAVEVKVTFPKDYGSKDLAGQNAVFDVTVTAVKAPASPELNDEFAKGFGMNSLDALKEALKKSIERDFAAQARTKTKKNLLDELDEKYDFALPPSLVEQEFDGVWKQIEGELQRTGKSFTDEGKTEEEARAEYMKIAVRRVRLGLVLAEIGEKAEIKITEDEVNQALITRARQFPGQEKQVWEFYRKNPQAMAELRAPVFEEKVVDHILSQIKLVDKTISRDDLFKGDEPGE